MVLLISGDTLKMMEEHALQSYPCECCGMLFGNKETDGSFKVKGIKNVRNRILDRAFQKGDADKSFEISPLEIFKSETEYKDKGLELIGFYHSHPDKKAVLSEKDKKGMVPEQAYVIISVTRSDREDVRAFRVLGIDKEDEQSFEETEIKIL